MVARGEAEKKRRDMRAREEVLEVGMKVLLKRKHKRKGISKYDPDPFILEELVGRQAVISRGDTILRRETQKIKRFHEPALRPLQKSTFERDEWEENFHSAKSITETNQEGAATEERENEVEIEVPVQHEREHPEVRQETTIAPARRSARENRGRGPKRYGDWTNK